MLEGIDVSYSNVRVNTWADFVIIRACYGSSKDIRFDEHYKAARKLGVPVGAYSFLVKPSRTGSTIPSQVSALLNIAGHADGLAFDWEGANPPTKESVRQAIQLTQDAGYRVGFYASDSVYFDAGQDWTWIAHYGTNTWPTHNGQPADIWQYQGAPLDRDRYKGSKTDLLRLWEGTPPESDTGGDMGFAVVVPTDARVVKVDVAAGVEAFRLIDGSVYVLPQAANNRTATSAVHKGGSAGFLVNFDDGTAHFVRSTDVKVEP
jgi:hypothetical protein